MQDIEIIIVDDGSNDHTKDVIDSFQDSRIAYYYQENKGHCVGRNVGARLSNSNTLTFVDDDDLPRSDWAEKLYAPFISEANVVVCASVRNWNSRRVQVPETSSNAFYKIPGTFANGTFALDKSIYENIGGFCIDIRARVQNEFRFRLTEYLARTNGKVVVVNEPLIELDMTYDGAQRVTDNLIRRLEGYEYTLSVHKQQMMRDPKVFADISASAADLCVRTELYDRARSHSLNALRANPYDHRHYVRLMVALFPRLNIIKKFR